MDISTTISTIGQAITVAKTLKDFDQSINNADFKLRIAELTSLLADIKMELADTQLALREKEAEISTLKTKIAHKETSTVQYEGYTYPLDDSGNQISQNPYCSICLENGSFQILQHTIKPGLPSECPKCKSLFMHVDKIIPKDRLT